MRENLGNSKLAETDLNQFNDHLKQLQLSSVHPRVVVHGRLLSFGRIAGGVETVYGALRNILGNNCTIAVPTYTFYLKENDVFDPSLTEPRGMGAFSSFVFNHQSRVRTKCPIHSHAIIGQDLDGFKKLDGTTSIGSGSDFEYFFSNEYDLLLLGCGLKEGGTYLHHLEALAEVPYREWIRLKRKVRNDSGVITDMDIKYYARNSSGIRENFGAIENELVSMGEAIKVSAPYGYSLRIPLKALHSYVMKKLFKDPYYLASN